MASNHAEIGDGRCWNPNRNSNENFTYVGTQADFLQPPVAEITVQTDIPSEVQATSNDSMDTHYIVCEGNYGEKFYPLILKHNGIFKDATGS